MKLPNGNKIQELLFTHPIRYDYLMELKGLYVPGGCPEEDEIFVNPRQHTEKYDFYATIIHEYLHHLDEDQRYTEDQIDIFARALSKKKDIELILDLYIGWAK